jgi:G:T-mismatch repair DNA endonuclease (very short patch repair protein)
MTCVDIADKFGVSFTYITKLIHSNGFTPLKYSVSSHERKISEWLSSLGISYESSNRTILGRKELDLYISDSKLAIEINGLYWHSYSCKETKEEIFRHHTKRQMCVDKGIKLIQFTDKELIDKQDICKSIIYNNIGRYDTKIRASDCEIYYPTNTEYKNFLEENHIQGHINTSERLSLRYRGEIVAMMSVGKSRFQPNKKELLRFCIKKYTKVYGAGSKLFNNLKEDGMISYCSLDYFDGKLYEQLGFTHSHDSPPGYFYVKNGNTILSRHNAQKSKLCKLLITYSEELTEYDNMFNNGYTRYWNCGNSVWIYNNKGN